jgi:hypothetical protein
MSDTPDSAAKPAARPLLPPAAQRALAEAAARRAAIDAKTANAPPEHAGRGGLDPVRYGDWEIKGLTADF